MEKVDQSYEQTEQQRQDQESCNAILWIHLMLYMTLRNGSGTDFGASQCIPMGPCFLTCRLTLGVFIPLALLDDIDLVFAFRCVNWP